MTLKEMLSKDFNVDLPISGEFGNSIDNPIIIHKTSLNDYIATEHFILKCIAIGRGIDWKKIGQGLYKHNDKNIDCIKIETTEITELEIITQIENYYFDITECMSFD
jgi:hypothetical protein